MDREESDHALGGNRARSLWIRETPVPWAQGDRIPVGATRLH
ncbi:hypothetical protein [Coleofasciculus sp.]